MCQSYHSNILIQTVPENPMMFPVGESSQPGNVQLDGLIVSYKQRKTLVTLSGNSMVVNYSMLYNFTQLNKVVRFTD